MSLYACIQDTTWSIFAQEGRAPVPKCIVNVATISLTLTFSWRSQSRPARSHEYPLCSSEEGESTHPIEDKRGREREGGREGEREKERERGRGGEGGGGRERERERE